MTETYTSGLWMVKAGEEDAFVAAWKEFVGWASGRPGSQTFRLERSGRVRRHGEDFQPLAYELVTEVS